jgi:tetratricopeptide (TPR) repeat protein
MSDRASRRRRHARNAKPDSAKQPSTKPESTKPESTKPAAPDLEAMARALRARLSGDRARDVLALAVLATVLYVNAFGVGLILDNQGLVVQDARVHAVRSENVSSIFTQDYMAGRAIVSGVYRPLTTLSYLVNYAVLGNGTNPAGYHAVNLLLHVANAALVYLLAGLLLRRRVPALCTAALFTAHPIATEAVTNVIGRADLLAALAVLGGTLLYVRTTQQDGAARRRSLVALGIVAFLGLLAKENAVAILGVMIAYDLTYRVGAGRAGGEPAERRGVGALLRSGYAAVLAAFAVVGVIRWGVYAGSVVQRPSFIDNPLVGVDFWTARLTALEVLGRSFALLVWPRTLSWDYSYHQIPLARWPLTGWQDWQAVLALVGVAVALGVTAWSRRRRPALCFFVLFALVTFLPTANLLVTIGTIMAERTLYLPSVGVAGCVVVVLGALAERLPARAGAVLMPAVVAVLVVALGARTIVRNRDWTDEVRLTQSGIESAPRSAKVYLAYASALSHQNGLQGADVEALIAHAEQALAIMDDPPLPLALQESNVPLLLGIYYKTKGTQVVNGGEEAQAWYQRAAVMLERAAAIQAEQNDEYRAAGHARGLSDDRIPTLGGYELPYQLGDLHMLLGEPLKAVGDFEQVRRLAPLSPDTHVAIARAATATGDVEGAVRALTLAVTLRRDPATQRLIVDAFRRLDPGGCSVKTYPDHVELDGTCPIVRTHFCDAYVELMELSIQQKQWYLGRRVGEAAIKTGDCDRAPFEKLLAQVAAEQP